MPSTCVFGFGASTAASTSATINAGTLISQTTYWDGSEWQPSSILRNDNTTASAGRAPISGTTFAVDNTGAAATTEAIRVSNLAARNDNAEAAIVFSVRGAGEAEITAARIRSTWEDSTADETKLTLEAFDGASFNTGITIDKSGFVGLGVDGFEPSFQLDVAVITSVTNPQVRIFNSSTGDASMVFTAGSQSVTMGIDNSDSDVFKWSFGTGLSAGAVMSLNAATGFVGVGTSNSSSVLEVFGSQTSASWGKQGIQFNALGGLFTDTTSSGTIAAQVINSFQAPTMSTLAVPFTVTDAANVYIEDAPTISVPLTATNNWALWVDAGDVKIDGNLAIGAGLGNPTAKLEIEGSGANMLEVSNSSPLATFALTETGATNITGRGTSTAATLSVIEDKVGNVFVRVRNDDATAGSAARYTLGILGEAEDYLERVAPGGGTNTADKLQLTAETGTSGLILRSRSSGTPQIEIALGTGTTDADFYGVWQTFGLVVGEKATPASILAVGGDRTAASWTTLGVQFNTQANNFTNSSTAASGTAASAVINSFQRPLISATNVTVTTTDAANVYIGGEPIESTNQTFTNAWALWVEMGDLRLDGNVTIGGITNPTAALDIQGSMSWQRVEINATTYTILTTDNIIGVSHTATAAVTLTLPLAANAPGHIITIKDEDANASVNNIDIDRAGSDTITDTTTGNLTTIISTDGGAIRLYSDGVATWYVF